MKKLLLGVLAIFALVACNRDEVVSEQSQSFISFGDSFVEVKTRAAVDPSTTTNTITAFDVWGFIGQPSGTVFEKERVTKGAEGWSYNNLQWWVADKTYYFHAISPVDDSNIKVDTKDMNVAGLGNIAFTNVNGTTDLLYATQYVTTGKEYPYHEEKVTMQFMHLLSKIKFTFKNGFTNENASLAVKNIVITDAPAEGNIDVNKERKDFVWNLTQNKTTKLEFGNVNGGKVMPLYNPEDVKNGVVDVESAVERLTIPADATRSYTIEFDLELYYGDQLGMTSNRSITLENQAFAIGKNYNLVATITPENFVDGGLMPIVFDVEVDEWSEGNFNGGFDFDDNGTNDGDDDDDNTDEPTVETYKLYFNNAQAWSKVYVYAWDSADNKLFGEWPGVEITDKETVEEVEYFAYTLPAELTGKTINLIFNNGEGQQTADIKDVLVNENRFYTNYVEPAPEPEPTDTVLYLTPNSNWKVDGARFAAYFFGNGETWASMTLVEGETNLYSVVAPDGYANVIFCRMNPANTENNWNNKWNQTSDLKVPTDGTNHYTVAEGAWDNGNGTWSTYTPAVKPEPVALDAPVVATSVNVNVVTLTWEAVEGASHYTVQVDDDVEEEVYATSYEFNGDYEVEYQFTVKAIAANKELNLDSDATVVSVTTEAEPVVEPEEKVVTVAEFLAAEVDDATFYTLKGTITYVENTNYGNFNLTDETGTIYVYGLYSEDGATNKYWAASGAKLGDDIVISAVRAEFKGSAQAGSARFMGLTSPGTRAFWTFDATSASFTAAAGEKKINVAIYNTNSEVVTTSDNAQFSAAYADGVLTVSALENTSTEGIEGNITVTCGTLTQVVTVSQLGASSSEQTTNSATISFEDKANRTSYTTSQQIWEQNGIKVTNDKASSTSNVGDYANPARFYKSSNVTIEAPGAILSITINVSGVESKYTSAWGTADNGIVTITLDGSSNTYEFNTLSAQARAYSMTVTYIE
ncbi:MAG: starch-binding protein [Alistipes sp.]|nr:starch-binding protein [Alistipes sp.]